MVDNDTGFANERAERSPKAATGIASAAAFLLYQALAIAFYGRSLLPRFTTVHAGQSSDPTNYIWCMVWWLYAPMHHLNPFFTKLLWAPDGFNLAWSTSIPLLSVAAAPLTLWLGPIVSFNVLGLVLPALSAWSGFWLIRRIVGETGPALLGGYIFGFSAFMAAAQSAGHIVFTAAFFIPVAIALVLDRLDERITVVRFTALLATVFVAQFLVSIEVLATMVMFGAIALAAAALFWSERRAQLFAVGIAAGVALIVTAVALSPYLFYMVRASGIGMHPVWAGTAASDLVEFIVPTRVMLIGGFQPLRTIAAHYLYDSYVWDSGAYASLPVIALAISFIRSRRHERSSQFLTFMIATIAIAMLGRHLRLDGRSVLKLPWLLIGGLPFINNAVTSRFALYYHLLLALTAASWMAQTRRGMVIKCAVTALIVLLQLPNPDSSFWSQRLNVPVFFTSGSYQQKLREGETVVVLPYAKGGALLWQIYSGMYFALAEGAGSGPIPEAFQAWPIVGAFRSDREVPNQRKELSAFLSAHRVQTILIDPTFALAQYWSTQFQSVGASVEKTDGIILVRMPIGDEAPSR